MSIFQLKQSPEELKSSNYGVSDFHYGEYTSSRDVTGTSFPNGRFEIPFELNSEQWWLPSRSYMRIRCNLTKGTGAQLNVGDAVAPNMNIAANLFQSMELQLNGKTLSRCSDHVAQVDTLEQRLHKSKAWMDSVGASINWLRESVDERINEVSSNGISDDDDMTYITSWNNPSFGIEEKANIQTNRVEAKLDSVGNSAGYTYMTITNINTALTAANAAAINNTIKGGDHIIFNNGGDLFSCIVHTDPATGNVATLVGTDIQIQCSFGANRVGTTEQVASQFIVKRPNPSRRITGFEVIWKPMCLSVFKYSGALPTGRYNLICTPHNASGDNYKIRAIECPTTLITLPTFGEKVTDVKFEIDNVRLYVAQVVGERVEDMTYYLDLESTRLSTQDMPITSNLSKEYFNVSPLTYALTVAFQDINAGIDPRHSASRFKVKDVVDEKTGATTIANPELKLTRMFVQYAGKSFPQPDADPSFKTTNANDYTTQRYVETQINCGSYFSEGGGETITDWQKRGSIHYFSCPKDGQDRSTRVTVNYQFNGDFSNKSRLLLFDHHSASAKITVQRGLVTDVEVIDA